MLALTRPARLLFVLFLAVLLAACVPASSTPTGPATPGAQFPTTPPQTPAITVTRLTLWHAYGGALGQSFDALVQQFNQTHPTIQVESSYGGTLFTMREKLVTALAAKSGPDMAQIDQFWSSELADAGALVSLDDFIAGDASLAGADIWDKAWQTASYQGKRWSMPFALSNIALYYNKALFQKAGLDPDQPPVTWEMLAAIARQLTLDADQNGTPEQWGITMPLKANEGNVYYWLAFLWQNNGALFSDDFKAVRFDEAAGVEALQFWVDLAKKDRSLPLAPPENGFEGGKVGMAIASTARLSALRKALGPDNLGMAPLPGHKRTATGGYLPLRQSVVQSAAYQDYLKQTPQAQVILDQMAVAVVRPNVPAYTPVSREIGLAIEAALFTDISAQAALTAAAAKAASAIK